MAVRGIRLVRPNQICDLMYCYCGIRLRPLRCPEAFRVDEEGIFVGDRKVEKLESDCINNVLSGLGGCSKCLHALNQMRGAVRDAATHFSTAIVTGRCMDKVHFYSKNSEGSRTMLAFNQKGNNAKVRRTQEGHFSAADTLLINDEPYKTLLNSVKIFTFRLFSFKL